MASKFCILFKCIFWQAYEKRLKITKG